MVDVSQQKGMLDCDVNTYTQYPYYVKIKNIYIVYIPLPEANIAP